MPVTAVATSRVVWRSSSSLGVIPWHLWLTSIVRLQMWSSSTSTKRSGTSEYPSSRDLISGLLGELVAGEYWDSWVHFELEGRVGTISRLSASLEESIEVALTKERFELNMGARDTAIPSSWSLQRNRSVHVPLAEQESLVRWIDAYFEPLLAKSPSYTLKGWMDGL